MKYIKSLPQSAVVLYCLFSSLIAHASVESTLNNVQSKLINTILPAISIMGLVMAGLSFAMGNENAKRHVGWAIAGTILGFAAPSIISFLQGLAH